MKWWQVFIVAGPVLIAEVGALFRDWLDHRQALRIAELESKSKCLR